MSWPPREGAACTVGVQEGGRGACRQTHVLPHPRLSHCKLPNSICLDLAEALRAAPRLTELCLLQNGLSEGGLRVLSEGLCWPQCRVQKLR